jgi:hypothetical protein
MTSATGCQAARRTPDLDDAQVVDAGVASDEAQRTVGDRVACATEPNQVGPCGTVVAEDLVAGVSHVPQARPGRRPGAAAGAPAAPRLTP